MNGIVAGGSSIRALVGTDPAAGVEISEFVPVSTVRRLMSISFTLVTDATAIERIVSLILDDGVNIFYQVAATQSQFGSQTLRYSVAIGVPETTRQNIVTLPIPAVWLAAFPANFRFRTLTTGLQPADDFTAPVQLFEGFRIGA